VLTTYSRTGVQSSPVDEGPTNAGLAGATWIDLLNPTPEELQLVQATMGAELPTRQEAEEIELSSRLYIESSTLFMIVTVMLATESEHPATTPVTFAYQPQRLVTVRFAEPKPFVTFARKRDKSPDAFGTAQETLLGLLDAIIDRIADDLEGVGADLGKVSGVVFSTDAGAPGGRYAQVDFTAVLARIGLNGVRAANARESLVSVSRVVPFFAKAVHGSGGDSPDEHWKAVANDATSLADHAAFLSNKVNFFLDATLGRINIEENRIIKLFSVLAVVFLPPTLIASIYGMNFTHMPELEWYVGYPLALLLMVAAAIVPLKVFKRKGWM
jgi:magnesium transporter